MKNAVTQNIATFLVKACSINKKRDIINLGKSKVLIFMNNSLQMREFGAQLNLSWKGV